MALPSWLSVAFTIADFVVQRVDRVGPVSFEPPEKQPPEAATSTVDAPSVDSSLEEAPAAEVDTPSDSPQSFGFQAGGGGGPSPSGGNGGGGSGGNGGDNGEEQFRAGGGGQPSSGDEPTGGSDDDDDDNGNGSAQLARAGGGNDPTPAPPPEPPDDDDDNGGEEQEHHDDRTVQCSFRAMRPADQPTRYDVEKARDDAGEERPA
jgi:hypothetical protein